MREEHAQIDAFPKIRLRVTFLSEVPEARSLLALAGPHLCLGVGVGTVDAALMPLLAAVVDARHVAAYGAVYAIAQAAVAVAYFLGESFSVV